MSVGVDIHTNTANRCCVYQLGSINQKMKKYLEVPIQFLCVFVCDDGDVLSILKVYISVTYHKWYLWTHILLRIMKCIRRVKLLLLTKYVSLT